MNKDYIILNENNQEKKYQILLLIDNKYIIYTNINNNNLHKDIHVIKVQTINNNQVSLPISNEELEEINQKYLEIIK